MLKRRDMSRKLIIAKKMLLSQKQKSQRAVAEQSKTRLALTRISHNGIISRAASAENAFTSMIRGDQHYCHGDNWTPMAAIRLCTSQCPIRRHSYSLVADSADNPQISAA